MILRLILLLLLDAAAASGQQRYGGHAPRVAAASVSTEAPTVVPGSSSPTRQTLSRTEAPSARPTAASTAPDRPRLPLGDINVVVLTDVHSWVAGHGDEGGPPPAAAVPTGATTALDANYGHVLSFVQRLKAYFVQHEPDRDLWFVVNGDWVDGTGLALNGDPSHLIPLLEKMPWDAVNMGNHELYDRTVIEYATRPAGFVEWWGERYLTSNVVWTATQNPIGNRYRVLRGKRSNLLTFGFLFNMKDNSKLATVQEVGDAIHEKWFSAALQDEEYDAILVLAHMGVRDPLVRDILARIRSVVGERVPVQFLTGHTHYRDFEPVDAASTSVEAGRYLDTVGFVSFPTRDTVDTQAALRGGNVTAATSDLFRHIFLDANVETLQTTLRAEELLTPDGAALSAFIDRTRQQMGLEEPVGCISGDLYLNNGLGKKDSLWRFFRDNIVPAEFGETDVLFMGKGMWRYDLYSGTVLLDDLLSVAPFNETFHVWTDIPGQVIYDLNLTGNNVTYVDPYSPPFMPELPEFILSPASTFHKSEGLYNLITNAFESKKIELLLDQVDPDFHDRQPILLNLTATDLWIKHFREERHIFGCSSLAGYGSRSHGKNSYGAVSEEDVAWLLFLVPAIMGVFVLFAWHVHQRGVIHRRIAYQRDFASDEARREFEDAQGYSFRDRYDSEGSEDEFI